MLTMVPDSPDAIPLLRRASVPKQRGTDALVTSMAALLDRSVMRTVSSIAVRLNVGAIVTGRVMYALSHAPVKRQAAN